jgi:hypothetical protein
MSVNTKRRADFSNDGNFVIDTRDRDSPRGNINVARLSSHWIL